MKRFPTLTDKTLIDLRSECARVARVAAKAMDDRECKRMMNVVCCINETLIDRSAAREVDNHATPAWLGSEKDGVL